MRSLVRSFTTAAVVALALVVLVACDSKPGPLPPLPGLGGSSDGGADSHLGPDIARDASRGDEIYKPHSNVEQQAAIAADAGEIVLGARQGDLSTADARVIYENGKAARGSSLRTLANDEDLAAGFPEETQFFGTPSFLDAPLMDAMSGTGAAASYSPAQRRQAIMGGLQRLMAYTMLHQMQIAEAKLRKGDPDPSDRSHNYVDRAWAFYTATAEGERRPGSLATTAADLERAFGRDGAIDKPLRSALATMQDGAARRNLDTFQAGRAEAEARLNTIFYLATARQLTASLRAADGGDAAAAAAEQAQGLATYAMIQPPIAEQDPAADRAITDFFLGAPEQLTAEARDTALAALNRATAALNLKSADQVSASDYRA